MRFMVGAGTRVLHIDISTGRWARESDNEPGDEAQRDTQLDALVERPNPHPDVDRPIGFRRNEEDW